MTPFQSFILSFWDVRTADQICVERVIIFGSVARNEVDSDVWIAWREYQGGNQYLPSYTNVQASLEDWALELSSIVVRHVGIHNDHPYPRPGEPRDYAWPAIERGLHEHGQCATIGKAVLVPTPRHPGPKRFAHVYR